MAGGRPISEKTFTNMLRIALMEARSDGEGTKLRAVADQLVSKAMSGDVQAIKEVADRLEGKPAQAIQADINGELVIQVLRLADNPASS